MKQNKGFTLVEIMIVVAIIALLAAIAIPSFMKSRADARASSCVNNLRLIEHAKQQYATSQQQLAETTVLYFSDIAVYLKGMTGGSNSTLICREGGTYTVGAVNALPTCSFSDTHILKIDAK